MFKTKYRISRDKWFSHKWAVQYKFWWWPFWIEFGNGLLETKDEAYELIELLQDIRFGK